MEGRSLLLVDLGLYGLAAMAFLAALPAVAVRTARGVPSTVLEVPSAAVLQGQLAPSRRFAASLLLFAAAFAANLIVLVARALETGHAPFQTLYETFLLAPACLAAGFLVILALSRPGSLSPGALRLLALVGAMGAAAAGATLAWAAGADDTARTLPPALQSGWFVPHVVVYFFGYGAGALACLAAALALVLRAFPVLTARLGPAWAGSAPAFLERLIFRMVALGFPFLTAGLVFGALWAEDAWGTSWGWDAKEIWALITWAGYLVYLHLRRIPGFAGASSAWTVLLCGFVVLVTYQFFGYLPASVASLHNYGGLAVPGAMP